MDIRDLKPAKDFAIQYGIKALVYGPPGSAKTPTINTCPRPVLLATESGLLSMRGSNVPTWQAFTGDRIDEFFQWLLFSKESSNFDTVCIDSVSHLCEIYLVDLLNGKSKSGNKAHGQAAYGEMAKMVMNHLRPLFYMQNKHNYLIAKEETTSSGMRRPYFPGKYLPVELPHMYDCIIRLAQHNVPSMGQILAFRCNGSYDEMARNRTGNLADFEPPIFSQLIQKAMS